MSPLPGWRLVWSLYGRFWCRSSLEVLRQWRTGARACGQGPCGAVSPATSPLIEDIAFYDPQRPHRLDSQHCCNPPSRCCGSRRYPIASLKPKGGART